ncbi:MAG: aliphatic sulfonate ABC transporter substrate-binding protein [Stellaceae bacterium]
MNSLFRLLSCIALVALMALPGAARADEAPVLRIGYQKAGTLAVLKQEPRLATRLAALHVALQWVEFPSGPPLLEALNAGSVDFGYTGDAPPIFAQAAGARLVYVGYLPSPGASQAILVRENAPCKTVADLRGKRVAFTKGSSAHNLVVKALAAAGLAYGDIEPAYLQPPDAAAAFRSGSIDAWAIWDPFYALTERSEKVRVLITADKVAPSNAFFLANRDYAAAHAGIIVAAVDDMNTVSRWSETHQDEVAAIISKLTGVDLEAEKVTVARSDYGVAPLTEAVIAEQQEIADTFHALGVIPRAIQVRKAVWTPPVAAAAKE